MFQTRKIVTIVGVLGACVLAGCGGGGGAGEVPADATPVVGGMATGASAAPSAPLTAAAADSAALSCGLDQPAGIEAQMLALVNRHRAQGAVCGGAAYGPAMSLAWNGELLKAAASHSADMAQNGYFSHTSKDGRTPPQRLVEAGSDYSSMGENIAAGQPSVEAAVNAWLTSPDHCKNLMNPVFRDVAVACIANPGSTYVRYWSMELGREF